MSTRSTVGPSRFDLVLLSMAAAVVAGLALGLYSPLSVRAGGSLGSLVACVAMFDGLVRNPPGEE